MCLGEIQQSEERKGFVSCESERQQKGKIFSYTDKNSFLKGAVSDF